MAKYSVHLDGKVFSPPPKRKILTVVLHNCEIAAVKRAFVKSMLLNFVDLSTKFYPTLSEDTYFHL